MPSKYRLRKIFKPLIQLLAKGLIRIRVTPNLATILMLCFSFLSFIWLSVFQNLIIFSFLVFLTGIMDGCDGAIARLTQKSTKFGGFFDSVMDRISEFFIFLGLIIYSWNAYLWNLIDVKLILFITYLVSFMISYCRVRAEIFFKGDFDLGLMARSERLFYIFIMSLIGFFYDLTAVLIFVFMWLVLGTYIYRIIKIFIQIENKDK
ncbi:MAG: CDP-alcohol phosphatidyltransferase family protein [Promethearchaeota archaeon]